MVWETKGGGRMLRSVSVMSRRAGCVVELVIGRGLWVLLVEMLAVRSARKLA